MQWYEDLYPYIDQTMRDPVREWRDRIAELLRIRATTADENRLWIKRICVAADINPTTLARAAGLSPSTINRFVNQPEKSGNISARTMAAIMEAAMNLAFDKARFISDLSKDEARLDEYFDLFGDLPPKDRTRVVPIIGGVKISEMRPREYVQFKNKDIFKAEIPVKGEYTNEIIVGLEYWSDYYSGSIRSGDTLFCVPLWRSGITLDDYISDENQGAKFVVNQKFQSDLITTSLREIIKDHNSSFWLVPVENEAKDHPPIYLGKKPFVINSDSMTVSFVVISILHSV